MLRPPLPLAAPLGLLLLFSCRARWRPVGVETLQPPGSAEETRLLQETVHGHRDFDAAIESVWEATREALHADGIAVPTSARTLEGTGGRIELEELDVRVTEEVPGTVSVRLHFRQLSEAKGVERAQRLLDEIEGRLFSR